LLTGSGPNKSKKIRWSQKILLKIICGPEIGSEIIFYSISFYIISHNKKTALLSVLCYQTRNKSSEILLAACSESRRFFSADISSFISFFSLVDPASGKSPLCLLHESYTIEIPAI